MGFVIIIVAIAVLNAAVHCHIPRPGVWILQRGDVGAAGQRRLFCREPKLLLLCLLLLLLLSLVS